MTLAYALIPLGIMFLLVILVLAFGHLALRQNGRGPVKRPTSYVVGVGTLNIALSILFGVWALTAAQAGITATEMALLCMLALWVITLAGFIPTIGLRQLFGDPDDETEAQRRQRRLSNMEGNVSALKEL